MLASVENCLVRRKPTRATLTPMLTRAEVATPGQPHLTESLLT